MKNIVVFGASGDTGRYFVKYFLENLALYITNSFKIICKYLDIHTELKKDCSMKGQEKVLSICSILGATEYYNAIGGQQLYSYSDFQKQGISLKFLQTQEIVYEQFQNEFQPNLSIIDVMMFNSVEQIQQMLQKYTLECE